MTNTRFDARLQTGPPFGYRRQTKGVVIVVAALSLAGCSAFNTDAHVISDTTWSGSFEGRTVDGTGNQTVSLGGGTRPKCASVQKRTERGTLTLKIDGGDEKTTTAAFGVVSGCSRGQ